MERYTSPKVLDPALTKCPNAQILEDSLSDQDYPDSDSPFLRIPRNKKEEDEVEVEDFQFDYYKDRVLPDYYPEDEELEVEDEEPDEDREKKDDSNSDGNEADVDEDLVLPTPKRKRNVQPKKDRKRAAKVAKRAKHEEANEAPSNAEEQPVPSTLLTDAKNKAIQDLTEQLEASCSCSE